MVKIRTCDSCEAFTRYFWMKGCGKCQHPDSEFYQKVVEWNDTCELYPANDIDEIRAKNMNKEFVQMGVELGKKK